MKEPMPQTFEALQKRCQDLKTEVSRLLGRKEEAERSLEAVIKNCEAKGIDPTTLEKTIADAKENKDRLSRGIADDLLSLERELKEVLKQAQVQS